MKVVALSGMRFSPVVVVAENALVRSAQFERGGLTMRGRKPKPTAVKLLEGNRGKRALNQAEPKPPKSKPTCPPHLLPAAKAEWRRLCTVLHEMGVVTTVDRAALAAYCQAYARWVDAETKLAAGPSLIKTPSGYAQQSPWLSIANKQMELMGRYMAELGLSPASRSRIVADKSVAKSTPLEVKVIRFTDTVSCEHPKDEDRRDGPVLN